MNKIYVLFILALATLGLSSCNSNDDATDSSTLEGTGITISDDVDCCSAEEALQVYKFLQTVKIIPELSTVVNNKYNLFAYSKTGKFHTGYNDIYFVATKKVSGNYVKDFDVTNITPLMYMQKMNMHHSTPISDSIASFNSSYRAVKHGWISFLMNSTAQNTWSLSYDARVLSSKGGIDSIPFSVDSLSSGQSWLKSFKVNGDTYFISLVNPSDWKTGTNTIEAYISKKSSPITTPYPIAAETFTIEFTPTMPDMGNHTSPDNVALTKQTDNSYQGTINLTMTGLWRIHLTVKDANGNIVAGGDSLSDGYSSLYFDVTL